MKAAKEAAEKIAAEKKAAADKALAEAEAQRKMEAAHLQVEKEKIKAEIIAKKHADERAHAELMDRIK